MGGGEALGRILVVFNWCCLKEILFLLVCGVVWKEVVRGVLEEGFERKGRKGVERKKWLHFGSFKGKMWLSVKNSTICSSYFLLFFKN
jgi:hypothetical protein